MSNLQIKNTLITGKLPFKNNLRETEICEFIELSSLQWVFDEEVRGPRMTLFDEKKGHKVAASVFPSGAICIYGALSLEEAEGYYEKILEEFEQYCKRVFN